MKKEFKYFFYVFTIISFIFFIGKYYFSDKNKKNSYRSIKLFENKMIEYSNNLKTLDSDTDNIIEYIENSQIKDKKKYRFWELLINDKK